MNEWRLIADDGVSDSFGLAADEAMAIRVGDGAFWIIKPNYDDDRTSAYGVVDESGKVKYTEQVPEIVHEPDYAKALAALKS